MSADAAARLAVIDPEAPDRRIGVAEGHVLIALRVREAGGVEVEPEPPLLRPVHPALEVLWPDLAALHGAVRFQVDRVQVEALGPRGLGHRHLYVGAQLVRVPGAPGIVAGGLDCSRTAWGTASPGRNSSTAYDWRTRARASASDLSTPRAISWLHAFPSAEVSTGPALTGSRQASAQSWSSRRFWQPPPTMWMRDRGRPRSVSTSSFTFR